MSIKMDIELFDVLPKCYLPTLDIPNTVDAIQYYKGFNITTLDPQIGNIFQFFIPQTYISFQHDPIKNNIVYGSTYYSPTSDISAIVFHSGVLFIHSKLKENTIARYSTVHNLYESMAVPNNDYSKVAHIIDIPADLQIRGVLVRIYIDQSPFSYISTVHNNFKSTELLNPTDNYSLRIIDFSILTMYDDPPHIVEIGNYKRQTATVPIYCITNTGEIGIEYSPKIFLQIFSRFNIVRNTFKFFRFFFDVLNSRYEIRHISDTKFQIRQLIEQITTVLVRSPNVDEGTSVVIDKVEMSEFGVTKNALIVKGMKFSPVVALILVPFDKYRV